MGGRRRGYIGRPCVDSRTSAPDPPDDGRVDVTGWPLRELIGSDDTVLTNSLYRLLAEVEEPPENFTAFGNTP
jgi:FXSXX-COOH protein